MRRLRTMLSHRRENHEARTGGLILRDARRRAPQDEGIKRLYSALLTSLMFGSAFSIRPR
jgi:hypothetical protein